MTLNEALQILILDFAGEFEGDMLDLSEAKDLGMQAIMRLQTLRTNPLMSPACPLPSETDE